MDKVYIVTQGCYSDYHIVAAFSERKLAEAVVEAIGGAGGYDEGRVDEYELDRLLPSSPLWTVHMEWNGDTRSVRGEYVLSFAEAGWEITPYYGPSNPPRHLIVRCYARDKEHAIKIANERRAMLIAEGKQPVENE